MKTYNSELTISFDVDGTLALWENADHPGPGKIKIIDPYDKKPRYMTPHQKHVNFLKNCYYRGYQITVWSGRGGKWADAIARAFGLKKYITKCETKPVKVVDDLLAEDILTGRLFLENSNGSE